MRYYFFDRLKGCRVGNDDYRAAGRVFVFSMLLIFLGSLCLCVPTSAEGKIYDNVIRFHVIADSDSDEDQALKLELRDAVLSEYGEELGSFSSRQDALDTLSFMTGEINTFCEEFIRERGFDYNCTTILDEEYYNRTIYDSFTMPSGTYASLRIKIGDAEGKNWWCVLFPPMCTRAALNEVASEDIEDAFIEAGFTGEQYKIITQNESPKYRIKFRLIELLFGK